MSIDDSSSELRRLTNVSLGLLSRREYSRGELRERLARRCPDEQIIEDVLDALSEQGYQSDLRFCESYIRFKVSQGKGPARIKQDLRLKKLDGELIESQLNELSNHNDEFWRELASDLYEKKYSNIPVDSDKERAKRLRFIVSRGFSPQTAYDLMQCRAD